MKSLSRQFLLTHICCIICFLSVLTNSTSLSQSDDSVYYTNPDYHVAKELFNKRIVMIGDFGHQQPGPFHRLYLTLDNWLQLCATKNKAVNLTLVIEFEKAVTDEINKYISTGDMEPLINAIAPDFNLETFEYYANLRNFSLKVDSINQFRKNEISFTVKGFEPYQIINIESLAVKPRKEWELWFINERDSLTSGGIINYMESNPKEQILIFYGTGHLQCGLVNKSFGSKDLSDKEYMGYFLPHYLKKKFGDDNVVIFLPCNYLYYYNKHPFNHPALDTLRDKLMLVKSKYFADTSFFYGADYVISVHCSPLSLMDVNYICSRFILEKTLAGLKRVKKWLPGLAAQNLYYKYLAASALLTGHMFRNDTVLNEWVNNSNFDVLNWLYSDQLKDTLSYRFDIFHQIDPLESMNFINKNIQPYGIAFWVTDSNVQNYDQWKEQEFPEIIRHIKFTNSIGIYWFGYPDEKIKAKEYLKEFSGEDFQEPEKYVRWYRMKFYGYDY